MSVDPGGAAAGVAALPRETVAAEDLFVLGRKATALRRLLLGDRATFVRARQLLATGAWRGPRDAAESYLEEDDLLALGGWALANDAGVKLLVGGRSPDTHRAAHRAGARSLWRFSFRSDENEAGRLARLAALRAQIDDGVPLWGIMPTPEGEPQGLDTLRVIALCRLTLPAVAHVVVDVALLGPRLAQMGLGFGADEIFAPIVSERALRLGANANNPAMTRKEAAILIRGAGLTAAERLAGDVIQEEPT